MSFLKRTVATTVALTMLSSSALAAEAIRPTMSLSSATGVGVPAPAGTRLGGKVEKKNDLLGAPAFLLFLGAVVITITTIIIINNNHDHPRSPG